MHATERQVDRLVFGELGHGAIDRHLGCPGNDHPVLGPVVVLLETEPLAGLYEQLLHLEAGAAEDRGVAAPWAVSRLVDFSDQIGRASCREGVEIAGEGGTDKRESMEDVPRGRKQ